MSEYIKHSMGPGSIGALVSGAALQHAPTIGANAPKRNVRAVTHGASRIPSLSGCGCMGTDNSNGNQFTRGMVIGPLGIILGAGLSGLLGYWAGNKWGKSENSGRNAAMVLAGLSVGTSLFTNKQSTGQFIPSDETIEAHREWLSSPAATTTIVMPGATTGPVRTNGNGQTALSILMALRADPLMAQVMSYAGLPSAEHVARMRTLKAKMESELARAQAAIKPASEQAELEQAMASVQGMIDMFNQSIPQMEAQITG